MCGWLRNLHNVTPMYDLSIRPQLKNSGRGFCSHAYIIRPVAFTNRQKLIRNQFRHRRQRRRRRGHCFRYIRLCNLHVHRLSLRVIFICAPRVCVSNFPRTWCTVFFFFLSRNCRFATSYAKHLLSTATRCSGLPEFEIIRDFSKDEQRKFPVKMENTYFRVTFRGTDNENPFLRRQFY